MTGEGFPLYRQEIEDTVDRLYELSDAEVIRIIGQHLDYIRQLAIQESEQERYTTSKEI